MSKASDIHRAQDPFPEDYVNPRGIPKVPFIENIDEFVKNKGIGVDSILRQFQEQHSKYKLMEHKLSQNHTQLLTKVPEINKTIDAVNFLKQKNEKQEEYETHYGLTDSVFCQAMVKPQPTVHLWLGANVMAEFPLDEAIALLSKNLEAAKKNLESTVEDLAWLRDQQVICEVNTSRVYNWDVVRRRQEKEKGGTA